MYVGKIIITKYHVDICNFFELIILLGRQCNLFIEYAR
jgi:hypothetical protein